MYEAPSELRPFLTPGGRLTALPAKHRKKLLALWYLAGKLDAGRQHTQPEINERLNDWALFRDPATFRRELYNKRLLNRTDAGSLYWRAGELPALEEFLRRYL